jgi:hypothetical protein
MSQNQFRFFLKIKNRVHTADALGGGDDGGGAIPQALHSRNAIQKQTISFIQISSTLAALGSINWPLKCCRRRCRGGFFSTRT